MTRYRMEGTSTAVGIPVAAYFIGLSLFALWPYSLLQPHYRPNPGLAAYKPPPATVIDYEPPTRLLAHHLQAPPSAEIESPADEPKTRVAVSKPEPTVQVKEPKNSKAKRPRERHNPFRDYAAAYPWYGGYRPSRNYAFQGYGGYRPF
jgi:hypothetical protein